MVAADLYQEKNTPQDNERKTFYDRQDIKVLLFIFYKSKVKVCVRNSSVWSLSQVCLLYQELTLYSSLMTSYFVYESELKNKSFAAFF